MKRHKQQKGFTLIELLVAISIFVVAMTSASAIFIAVIRSQQKNNAQRLTSQDARYAMEAITREGRMATGSDTTAAITVQPIDSAPAGLNQKLVITTYEESNPCSLTTKEFYPKNIGGNNFVLYVSGKDGSDENQITSSNLRVTQFTLENYINSTPTGPDYKPDRQPSITITITTVGAQANQQSQTTLRTTISSRDYNYAQ